VSAARGARAAVLVLASGAALACALAAATRSGAEEAAPAPDVTGELPLLLLDDEGRPCAGTTLTALHTSWDDASRRAVTVTTDAEGAAVLPLPQGKGRVEVLACARPPGHPPLALEGESAGEHAVDVLESETPPHVVHGNRCFPLVVTVLDHEGRAVPGAAVACERVAPPDTRIESGDGPTPTDAAGRVTFSAVPIGQREVLARNDDAFTVTRASIVLAPPGARLGLRLPPPPEPARLHVRFLDEGGAPVAPRGALAVWTHTSDPALSGITTLPESAARPLVGTESEVRLGVLLPGGAEVRVEVETFPHLLRAGEGLARQGAGHGATVAQATCTLASGVTATVEVRVPRTGTLRGVVLRRGAPEPRARVSCFFREGDSSAGCSVGPDGRFEVAHTGAFTVRALVEDDPAAGRSPEKPFRLAPGEVRETVLHLEAPATLRVLLRTPQGGPAVGRFVCIQGLDHEWSGIVSGSELERDGLRPGRILVSCGPVARAVDLGDGERAEVTLVVEPEGPEASLPAPPPGGVVTIRIEDPEGAAGPGDPAAPGERTVLVHRDGALVASEHTRERALRLALPAGPHELVLQATARFDRGSDPPDEESRARVRGPAASVLVPSGGEAEVVLRVSRAGALVVEASGLDEDPFVWVEVRALLPSGLAGPAIEQELREVSPGVRGARIAWLASGVRYRISIPRESHERLAAEAVLEPLAPGEERRVRLEARPRHAPEGIVRFEGAVVHAAEFESASRGEDPAVRLEDASGAERRPYARARLPGGRYRVAVEVEDPTDGATLVRDAGEVTLPPGGEATLRLEGLLGTASLTLFVRDRGHDGRPFTIAGGTLPPQGAFTNRPVRLERIPAGEYALRMGAGVFRRFTVAEGAAVDLGVVDAP
jgi:hypothetical protein